MAEFIVGNPRGHGKMVDRTEYNRTPAAVELDTRRSKVIALENTVIVQKGIIDRFQRELTAMRELLDPIMTGKHYKKPSGLFDRFKPKIYSSKMMEIREKWSV